MANLQQRQPSHPHPAQPSPSQPSQPSQPSELQLPQPQPQPQPQQKQPPHRLSLPPLPRILATASLGAFSGSILGFAHGSQSARLRFRAEHAHRMPTTTAAWYLYHKSQNGAAARGGIVEGARMGGRLGFWTALASALEAALDRYRGVDAANTVAACVSVAVWLSLWNRFPYPVTARMSGYGLLFGAAYGTMQDLVGFAHGRPVGYIDSLRRRFGGGAGMGGIS